MTISIHFAGEADEPGIRSILRREVMPGPFRLTFEREPRYFSEDKLTGETSHTLVATDDASGEVAALATRSARRVFLNGREQRIGYLSQLRIDSRYRGQWLVSRGFRVLRELERMEPLPLCFAAIVDGNTEAAGVLVRNRRKKFPDFREIAELHTLALSVDRARPAFAAGCSIVSADSEDLAPLAEFLREFGKERQLFPVWRKEAIRRLARFGLGTKDILVARRAGSITGVVALWDQRNFRQTVIQGYAPWLRIIKPLYNAAARLRGTKPLPEPGQALKSAYGFIICVANNEAATFRALLRELYNQAVHRGLDRLLVGFDTRDPMLVIARTYPHILYRSRLYLVEWPDASTPTEQLDGRPVYADIAML
jgi:hypothetical protein